MNPLVCRYEYDFAFIGIIRPLAFAVHTRSGEAVNELIYLKCRSKEKSGIMVLAYNIQKASILWNHSCGDFFLFSNYVA